LTAWFTGVLSVVLLLLAVTTWLALRESFATAIDQALADRVVAIQRFLEEPHDQPTYEELREDLYEYAALDPGWNLLSISDDSGQVLYRSPALESMTFSDNGELPGDGSPHYEDILLRGRSLRLVTAWISVRERSYRVHVAVPLSELDDSLEHFRRSALLLVPAGLMAAIVGGYWISRQALGPVDRIAAAAREITANRLGSRLSVPATGDELQRLSETLNEMLERLETAFAEMTRFTADASHELRTPLSLIRTRAELALRRPRTGEEYRAALEDILGEVERTSQLVQDLLTLARGDAGVDTPQQEIIDFREILLSLRSSLEALCDEHQLNLHLELPRNPLWIKANRDALDRLLLILAENSVRYTPAPGSISLSAHRSAASIELTFEDTGIGIAEEELPRVFDRFYRTDKARSRDSGGTGLGLSIAKWIVEWHDGSMEVESDLGKGCRVRVRLPAASKPQAPPDR